MDSICSNNNLTVGLLIKAARKNACMSQSDLATAIGKTSHVTVGRYETGVRTPTLETLKKIAKACHVQVEDLIPKEKVMRNDTAITPNEYQKLAMRTSNQELSNALHLMNGALGLCGESGEVADLVKKCWMQGHNLDREHIAKELGDICWYLAETATAIGYDLETIMQMNIDKLMKRYPEGFSAERSQHREQGDI